MKNWLIWKDSDAGKDWRREEKGMAEDEMVGWYHQFDGHELQGLVMDREAWRASVHGVAKSQTWLSDWTELNLWNTRLSSYHMTQDIKWNQSLKQYYQDTVILFISRPFSLLALSFICWFEDLPSTSIVEKPFKSYDLRWETGLDMEETDPKYKMSFILGHSTIFR